MAVSKETRLMYAIGLSFTFMLVEVIGGWLANSIAIYSDAAHLLTDIAGFVISLVAITVAKAPGTPRLTYGLVRAEIFGALLSVFSLWVISAVLLWAAFIRAKNWWEGHPDYINGKLMFGVALFGVLVNICLAMVFHEEHGHMHGHDHSHGHAHGHSHGHNHGYEEVGQGCDEETGCGHDHVNPVHTGHDHDHGHRNPNERSALVSPKPPSSYTASSKQGEISTFTITVNDDDDDDGDDHGHAHAQHSSSCSHDHDHGHDHGHGHHDSDHGHDHSHGHGHSHGHESSSYQQSDKKPIVVRDANLEAAQLHVLADLAQSIGVAIAGLIVFLKPHWQIVDPICTLLASLFGLYSTLPLIQRGVLILLEGTPSHVDWDEVNRRLAAIPGVDDVHGLHIWSLSSDRAALSVHLRATHPTTALREAHRICRSVGIQHATIQVHDRTEDPDNYCHSENCKDSKEATPAAPGSAPAAIKAPLSLQQPSAASSNGSKAAASAPASLPPRAPATSAPLPRVNSGKVATPVSESKTPTDDHDHDHDHGHGHSHDHKSNDNTPRRNSTSGSGTSTPSGKPLVKAGSKKDLKAKSPHNSSGFFAVRHTPDNPF